ncbi:hypothetical protein L9F63_005354, partial [Diploptera punctata]
MTLVPTTLWTACVQVFALSLQELGSKYSGVNFPTLLVVYTLQTIAVPKYQHSYLFWSRTVAVSLSPSSIQIIQNKFYL